MTDQLPSVGTMLSIAQFIWLIALTVGTWLRKPGDDAGRAVAELRDANARRDNEVNLQLQQLRSQHELVSERLRHLPTHGDIRSLLEGVSDLKGKVSSLADGQERQQRTLELIQEFMSKR